MATTKRATSKKIRRTGDSVSFRCAGNADFAAVKAYLEAGAHGVKFNNQQVIQGALSIAAGVARKAEGSSS